MDLKALKPLVASPHWGLLEEYLQDLVEIDKATLVRAVNMDNVRVLQGKLQAYERILEISERISKIKR